MICPNCGNNVNSYETMCPCCGEILKKEEKKEIPQSSFLTQLREAQKTNNSTTYKHQINPTTEHSTNATPAVEKTQKERKLSNNQQAEVLRNKIDEAEFMCLHETNPRKKIELLREEIELRQQYTPVLLKKRTLLWVLGLLFFLVSGGLSLIICLPPYIVRGKKRDINEEKLRKLKFELEYLTRRYSLSQTLPKEKEQE